MNFQRQTSNMISMFTHRINQEASPLIMIAQETAANTGRVSAFRQSKLCVWQEFIFLVNFVTWCTCLYKLNMYITLNKSINWQYGTCEISEVSSA